MVGCHDCRDVRAYQLENQLDIGDYDVRALLIRPLETERRVGRGETKRAGPARVFPNTLGH